MVEDRLWPVPAPGHGRLAVADALYFIAHEYMTGVRRVHPRVLGIGLGAALLGELVLLRNVDVHDGAVYVLSTDPPPDAAAHSVLADVMAQPQHRDLDTWLAYLAVTGPDLVVQRLRTAGELYEVEQRRLIVGSRRVLAPTDVNRAAWQQVRLERKLNQNARMWPDDCLLAGLVKATGLIGHVLWDAKTSAVGHAVVPLVIGSLAPGLQAIVRHAEAAVGRSVLAAR